MKIREVMRPGPMTVAETDSLGNAYSLMSRAALRHLPVMSDGKLVGMLSERDVLAARATETSEDAWWKTPVRDAMHRPVQTAGPDDSLTELAGRMSMAKIGAMPIVERGELLGIATVTDVLDAEVRSAMAPGKASQLSAADVMTPWPLTVRPDQLLTEAVAIMVTRDFRHLPVVEGSTVVGMLSETDVRTAIGDPATFLETRSLSPGPYRVKDVMTRGAVVVPFDRPLAEVARQFADTRVSAVPVVNKFGALIGIVSYVDALRALAS